MKKLKSMLHLAVQQTIAREFDNDAVIEKRFTEHIADVYIKKKKLVFEVQCSFINIERAKKRIAFYTKQNLTVIWVFHEKICHQKNISSTERYLLQNSHLIYTNVTQFGEGIFYKKILLRSGYTIDFSSPALEIHLPSIRKGAFNALKIPLKKKAKKEFLRWKKDPTTKKKKRSFYQKKYQVYSVYYKQILLDKLRL